MTRGLSGSVRHLRQDGAAGALQLDQHYAGCPGRASASGPQGLAASLHINFSLHDELQLVPVAGNNIHAAVHGISCWVLDALHASSLATCLHILLVVYLFLPN